MKKLSREEFYNKFVKGFVEHRYIKENCSFNFYWNGNEAQSNGFKVSSNSNGVCFWGNTVRNATIVIKYRESQLSVLKTFIHEIGHLIMHSDYTALNKNIKEIEAETVAKKVFLKLNLPYHYSYIERYQKKYSIAYDSEYVIRGKRKELLDKAVNITLEILTPQLEVAENLNYTRGIKRQTDKYKVTCPCCNTVTNYRRRCKIINNNGKGYYCNICGRKTLNKLVVEEIY